MAVTPHISVRVYPDKVEKWQERCAKNGTDMSSQIRLLMDAWVTVEDAKEMDDTRIAEAMLRLLDNAEV